MTATDRELGLAALVEVHAPDEVDAAVLVGATLVGINKRNLATFQVDLTFEGSMPRGLLPGQALEGRLTLGGDRPADDRAHPR